MSGEGEEITFSAEQAFAARLWEHHGVRLVVRRQDPFGWA